MIVHHIIQIEIIQTIEIDMIQITNHETNPRIDQITKKNNNGSRENSRNRCDNYERRQRNYSKSPHRFNTQHTKSQQNYKSSAPVQQRLINQLQSTE